MAYLDPAAKGSAILTGINTASSASGFYEGTAKNFVSLTYLTCSLHLINLIKTFETGGACSQSLWKELVLAMELTSLIIYRDLSIR